MRMRVPLAQPKVAGKTRKVITNVPVLTNPVNKTLRYQYTVIFFLKGSISIYNKQQYSTLHFQRHKKAKILNNHNIILLFSDFYNIL